jgi:phospholipid transport system substrate-binding protein
MRIRPIGRRSFLAITIAITAPFVASQNAEADDDVLGPAHQLNEGLLQIMKAGQKVPFAQRFETLAPVIDKTFDLPAILKLSVGSAWQLQSPDQQAKLLAAFRRYTVASYVNSFDDFNGQRFLVNPEPRSVGDEQVVRTQIIPASGDSHELDYLMRQGQDGWHIVDVLAGGNVSRVAVQRSDFRQLIRLGGAAALSQSLDAKSETLSN